MSSIENVETALKPLIKVQQDYESLIEEREALQKELEELRRATPTIENRARIKQIKDYLPECDRTIYSIKNSPRYAFTKNLEAKNAIVRYIRSFVNRQDEVKQARRDVIAALEALDTAMKSHDRALYDSNQKAKRNVYDAGYKVIEDGHRTLATAINVPHINDGKDVYSSKEVKTAIHKVMRTLNK